MPEWMQSLSAIAWNESMQRFARALFVLLAGLIAAKVLQRYLPTKRLGLQQGAVVRRLVTGAVWAVTAAWLLRELGFELGPLLGAAGVLTVALGFASQTSVSNIISGLFLIGERPFVLGDVIKVGDTTGEVLSVDLLSVKLRTFENLLVRIPNEALLKATVTNMTHFPIRRLDIQLSVAYREDVAKVREVLMDVADRNPVCLVDPPPMFIFREFGDSGLELQFSVWARRQAFLELRNTMHEEIKRSFDAHGISIPFPHRQLVYSAPDAPPPPPDAQSAV